jgi:hypothetical protein
MIIQVSKIFETNIGAGFFSCPNFQLKPNSNEPFKQKYDQGQNTFMFCFLPD